MPRLISCQSEGCAPIVQAFEKGERFAELFANAHTIASGLRVPAAVGDFMMLDAIRASGGCAIAGREARIVEWMRRGMSLEGVSLCPETAVCLDALEMLVQQGKVKRDEEVVVFNTGAAQKYPEAVPLNLRRAGQRPAGGLCCAWDEAREPEHGVRATAGVSSRDQSVSRRRYSAADPGRLASGPGRPARRVRASAGRPRPPRGGRPALPRGSAARARRFWTGTSRAG